MKKIFASTVIAAMFVFSLAAGATGITFDALENTGTHFEWLFVGLGLMCFMKLRKEDNAA